MKNLKLFLCIAFLCFNFGGMVACSENSSSSNSSNPPNKFEEIYTEYYDANTALLDWMKLSPNKQTLTFDSNPNDKLSIIDFTYYDKMSVVIEVICREFNIPSYIYEQISKTAPADGVREYENEKISMKWYYNYDEGMKVICTLK